MRAWSQCTRSVTPGPHVGFVDAMGAAVARLDTVGHMVGESPDGIMATNGFGSRVTMRGAPPIGGIAVGRARYGRAPR